MTELRLFLTAVGFYTRIPIPSWVGYGAEQLNASRKYFPLIGAIVGGMMLAVYFSSELIFPKTISILLSMIAGILTTGAFHEDGFADVCDGFGGGWTKEQILTIMKDSRVGTYGVVGLGLLLSLKFLILLEIAGVSPHLFWSGILSGQIVSRFIASTMIDTHAYVRDIDTSKVKPMASARLKTPAWLVGFFFGLVSLLTLPSYWLGLAAVVAFGSKVVLAQYFKRWIGGYTGDCLGAIQQVSEVIFYLSLYAGWKCL